MEAAFKVWRESKNGFESLWQIRSICELGLRWVVADSFLIYPYINVKSEISSACRWENQIQSHRLLSFSGDIKILFFYLEKKNETKLYDWVNSWKFGLVDLIQGRDPVGTAEDELNNSQLLPPHSPHVDGKRVQSTFRCRLIERLTSQSSSWLGPLGPTRTYQSYSFFTSPRFVCTWILLAYSISVRFLIMILGLDMDGFPCSAHDKAGPDARLTINPYW